MRLLGCERVEQLGPHHVSFRLLLPFILYLRSATGQHSRGGTADLRRAPRARLHPLSIPCEALGNLDSAFSSVCVIYMIPLSRRGIQKMLEVLLRCVAWLIL